MKKAAYKRKLRYLVLLLCAALFLLSFKHFFTFAYWKLNIKGEKTSGDSLIVIGEWAFDPDTNALNERVAQIVDEDPLLALEINSYFILGNAANPASIAPVVPEELNSDEGILKAGTVLFWVRSAGAVVAAQITGDIPYNIYIEWLSSWEALENALNNTAVTGGRDGAVFFDYTPGKIYTTAHAPVYYDNNKWLARHDRVTSLPAIGSDWFLISDVWQNQKYPSGALAGHNGKHYRKISTVTDGEPSGTTSAGWKKLEGFEPAAFSGGDGDIPAWSAEGKWRLNDIVLFGGNYYICIHDLTDKKPDENLPLIWEEIPEYSESEMKVPHWEAGAGYNLNGVVNYDNAYYIALESIGSNELPPAVNNKWQVVKKYEQSDTVPVYAPGANYSAMAFVSFDKGYFIAVNGCQSYDKIPGDKNGPWTAVPNWDEATGAVEDWVKGKDYSGTSCYAEYAGKVYELTGNPANPNSGKTPASDNAWVIVPRWSEIVKAGGWNGQQSACTSVGGRFVVWTLNSQKTFTRENPPAVPALDNDDWIRYSKPCTAPYICTRYNGRIVLWIRGVEGSADIMPGIDGSSWNRLGYRTGHKYVYTLNTAGAVKVWYSENESSIPPAAGLPDEWTELYSSFGAGQYSVFYIKTADAVYYYETVILFGDGTTERYIPGQYYGEDVSVLWFELSTAWTGGNRFVLAGEDPNINTVSYNWNSRNIYMPGDIAVFGHTLTNTYRYFRLKDNINPFEATGREPASITGLIYWEPLNIIGAGHYNAGN